VVQFRALADVHSGYENEYTQVNDLMYPQLLISFENNSVSGYSSAETSFYFAGKDWTADGSMDLSGTYDPETGVVEGTFERIYKFRYPPDPGFYDNGVDLTYYGTFRSYYSDPEVKFSLADAKLDLDFEGSVASDRYYIDSDRVFHTENQAGFLINFVRETPYADCAPSVYGLDPLVPGDVISPGATYSAPDGTEMSIIQERWFINGQEASSEVWDGNRTTVELQWTCPNHQAHSQTFEIAAYQPPPASAEPVPGEPASPGSPAGPGLADLFTGLGIGLLGLGGLTGLAGSLALGIPIVKAITAGPAVAAPVTPPAQAPATPDANPPTLPSGKLDPSLKKPWELKIKDLIGQRTNIQENIQAANDQIIRLTRLYKNNILKVIMKGGLEAGQILFGAATGGTSEAPNIAIEIGKKFLVDKAMDKAFQKHDTSQDGKTVVDLKSLIDDLKELREGLRNQVREINREIKGIQEHIRNEF
jgi:hypothetical protein